MTYDDIIVPELLPPSEDGVFKTLLTHPDAQPILRDVVESYLRFPVVKVDVRNVETPIADINEKRERFDVCCAIDDGSQADVEMMASHMEGDSQRTNHKIIKYRAIYNLCDLHAKQPGRGERYDKLLRSFQMTFCGYTVFHHREQFVRRFSFRDEYGEELSDGVGIIFIELTKLDGVIKNPVEDMSREEAWALFFAYAADPKHRELISKLMSVRSEIKMASELLQTISVDEDERARFRMRRKFEMDMAHNYAVVRDERSMEIAKNLLNDGDAIDKIIKVTGLTRKEVESLRDAE